MKNVLVLTSTFPRWKNDPTASFVYDLSSQLAKQYRMVVLAPHAYRAEASEKLGNLEVHRFKYFYPKYQKMAYGAGILPNVKKSLIAKIQIPFFLLSQLNNASKLIKAGKISLIHAHWMIPQGVIGAYLKRKHGIPLIVTIHGSDLFPLKSRMLLKLQKFVLENSDEITINSEIGRKELNSRFPSLKTKVNIIQMGIDTKLFSRNKKPKNQYKNTKMILFVGRLNEQKGVEYLIKAIGKAKKEIANVKLLIIGEGDRQSLQKTADSLDLSENVEFLGAKPKKELADYYSLADALVLPSATTKLGTEGFGLVLLEAMSRGTCVIGSSSGGIKEIIKDGENGLIFEEKNENDLAEKITSVLKNDKLRQKLANNGQKFSRENFGWDKIGKKFLEIYRRALK